MGLELPGELTEPLGWIGLTWPQADEEKLFADGQQWIEFGVALAGLQANADAAAQIVWTTGDSSGDEAINSFEAWWTNDDGPSARLSDDAVAAQIIGAALIVFAGITLAMKIAFIVQLIALAIEVAQAIATAFVSFGATTAEIPGFIAATRVFCRRLIRQIVEHVQTVIKELIQRARNLFKKLERKGPKPRYGPEFEQRMLDDLRSVNPHFDPSDPAYSLNCVHCVQAYELRRRGIDVEATGLPSQYWTQGGRSLSDIEHTWGRNFTPGSRSDIDQAFAEPGSRGIVEIRWNNGGGHVFNVENVNGEVRYIDAQSGRMYVQDYFTQGYDTQYLRTDDLATPDTSEFTQPAGG